MCVCFLCCLCFGLYQRENSESHTGKHVAWVDRKSLHRRFVVNMTWTWCKLCPNLAVYWQDSKSVSQNALEKIFYCCVQQQNLQSSLAHALFKHHLKCSYLQLLFTLFQMHPHAESVPTVLCNNMLQFK